MTAHHLIHTRTRKVLSGLAALALTAAATSVALLGAPTAATAAIALPCTYSETLDENGAVTSAVPDRASADAAISVHTQRASAQTPAGKIAVVYTVPTAGSYLTTSITATDSDGTFTTTGPAESITFDATTHTATPAPDGTLGAFPTATIRSVTICAAAAASAYDAAPCTQTKTAHYDGTVDRYDFTGDPSFFHLRGTSLEVAPPHMDFLDAFGQDIFSTPGITVGSVLATSLTGTDNDGTSWSEPPAWRVDLRTFTHHAAVGGWITTATVTGCYFPLITTMTALPTTTTTPTVSPPPVATTAPASAAATSTVATTTATAADPTTTPGGTETISAGGFMAGEAVSAVLHSTPIKLGNFTANAGGVVTVPFTVPATLETGAHSVVLTGLTSGHVATAHFTVVAAPTDLASTGVMHTGALLATGVGTVALGLGVLALTMWRRRMTPQH